MHTYLLLNALLIAALPISFILQYTSTSGKLIKALTTLATYTSPTLEDKLASAIYLSIALLSFMKLLHDDGVIFPQICGILIFSALTIATTILSWRHFKVAKSYKKHKAVLTTSIALLAVVISVVVSALTDSLISEITLNEASSFPVAQKGLTLVISLVVWTWAGTAIGIVAYGVIALWLLTTPQSTLSKSKTKFMGPALKKTEERKLKYETFRSCAILIGLIMLITAVPIFTQKLVPSDWFDRTSRTFIAFSSFHLPPNVCGLPNTPGTTIAVVRYRVAIIATPDPKKGYLFSTTDCHPAHQN